MAQSRSKQSKGESGMTQRKKKTDKYGKRTIMVPPAVDKYLNKLPAGTRSAWIVDAIEKKIEASKSE
jgi:hypothetical protein